MNPFDTVVAKRIRANSVSGKLGRPASGLCTVNLFGLIETPEAIASIQVVPMGFDFTGFKWVPQLECRWSVYVRMTGHGRKRKWLMDAPKREMAFALANMFADKLNVKLDEQPWMTEQDRQQSW